jgi:hypothetical protein
MATAMDPDDNADPSGLPFQASGTSRKLDHDTPSPALD